MLEGDLAIDTETMGLSLYRDRLCLLQLSNGGPDVYLVHFLDGIYSAPNLTKLLSDETKCKIFHFARFDMAVIEHYLGINIYNIFCTKIASRLIRTYTDSHGLKELCRELLDISISKQQQSSYWGREELTSEQKEYAAKDVLYLHQLKSKLEEMLKREGRLELAKEIFNFLPVRIKLDILGWSDLDIFAH